MVTPAEHVTDDRSARPGLVVAIDGPSGSGKSSTARGVAARLGLRYLDTGAMYRAVSWLVTERGIDRTDPAAVAEVARTATLGLSTDPEHAEVRIDGHDVTTAIREPAVSATVSTVATNLDVRAELIAQQRASIADAVADGGAGIVVEGRDITTVVAPGADLRILLVADAAARVARRQAELGEQVGQADVHDQVVRRDRDDATVAQFEQAADGVTIIDSTYMDLDEVIEAICALARTSRDRVVAAEG